MVSLRRCWVFTAVAMISATAALRYKYKIEFTACSDIYCQQGAIIEQKAPWKYVEDGQCKSYYHHTFPAWTHTWVGEPNGRECPQCPDSFGSCTISIYEKPGCTGLLYGGINEANLKNKDEFDTSYRVGEKGERASNVQLRCYNDWQR